MAEEILGALLGQFNTPALWGGVSLLRHYPLSAFVDLVVENSSALERLEAMIREKRRTRMHSVIRAASSYLRRSGGNLPAVQEHVRHSDIQTTTVYTRLTPIRPAEGRQHV